jgi:hypothetical protein
MPLERITLQHQRKSSNYKTHSNIFSHQTEPGEKIKRKDQRKKLRKPYGGWARWQWWWWFVQLGLLVAVRWLCQMLKTKTTLFGIYIHVHI